MSSRYLVSKHYEDKGVQTDPNDLFQAMSSCETLLPSPPEPLTGELASCPGAVHRSEFHLDFEGAYIHSGSSKTSNTPSRLFSRQDRKPWIGYNCPSVIEVASVAKRVVSLPDAPSSREIAASLEKKARIVSMPERGKLAIHTMGHSILSGQYMDGSVSGDIDYYSGDSNERLRTRDHERPYPSDLPQTPSPPSSPESIMIIGNEAHVPSSFLRRQYTDEHGWITWANSPPRPIPALHGPLSLPYARCPSGAEGTVIEGDDLSHKIWGLSVDDSQPHPRPNRILTSQIPATSGHDAVSNFQVQEDRFDSRQTQPSSLQRQRDAVIDLSILSAFYTGPDGPNRPQRHGPTATHHPPTVPVRNPARSFWPEGAVLNGLHPLGNVRPQNHSDRFQADYVKDNLQHSLGLGLKWNSSLASETGSTSATVNTSGLGARGQNRLNTAAPIFVPANPGVYRNPKNAYTQPDGPQDCQSSLRFRDLSSLGVAQQYCAQRDYNLPTPPSTSSPNWSPVFSCQFQADPYKTAAVKNKQPAYDPKIYSPHPDIDDYSKRLMLLMQQIGGQESDSFHERVPSMEHVGLPAESFTSAPSKVKNASRYSVPSTPQNDQAAFAETIDKSPAEILDTVLNQPGLISSDRRRNLSYQHPRSIPLARLIERRLSSVTEEDLSSKMGYNVSMLKNIHSKAYLDGQLPVESQNVQIPNQSNRNPTTGEALDKANKDANLIRNTVRVGNRSENADSSAVVRLPRKLTPRGLDRSQTQSPKTKGDERSDHMNEKENNEEKTVDLIKSKLDIANKKRIRYRKRSSNPPIQQTSSDT